MAGNVRNTTKLSCQKVVNFINGIIFNINGTNEQVIGNVIKVATELQPRSSSADVVGGALSFHLTNRVTLFRVILISQISNIYD